MASDILTNAELERATERLNETIEAVEAVFSQLFHVSAFVPFEPGKELGFKKALAFKKADAEWMLVIKEDSGIEPLANKSRAVRCRALLFVKPLYEELRRTTADQTIAIVAVCEAVDAFLVSVTGNPRIRGD